MRHSIITLFGILAIGCASGVPRYPAEGTVGLDHVATEVDSQLARYYLERYGSDGDAATEFDAFIDELLVSYDRGRLTTDALVQLALETSNDFASIYFARRMTREHLHLKKAFLRNTHNPRAKVPTERYTVIFVPGLFYESNPESKGDLRDAEAVVRSLGIATGRIATEEAATVEQNAAIIAAFIRGYPDSGRQIILVSASKGGPEVLHALGNLLTPEESSSIRAWISIGGVLRGSQIADGYVPFPKSLLVQLASWWLGFDADLARSLSTQRSHARLAAARIPHHITVLHYVGVPLSGTVSEAVRDPYESMSSHGPNDGLTVLTDQLLSDGLVLTDLGLDHRFAHPQIAAKTAALAVTMLEWLDAQQSGRAAETRVQESRSGQ